MKVSKIKIRNLFGITEQQIDGKSIELSGPKGAGKTSVLDAIRYALTNRSDRDYIIRNGAEEGEILIETDTGLSIERKTRTNKADAVKVKDGSMLQSRPAEFLNGIFTPLQLNPVEFTQMSRQEKNRVILSLIEFNWDLNWIKEQFGEIPQGVDYQRHILEVLADIQSEKGAYYQSRQEINSRNLHLRKSVEDIGLIIPQDYNYEKWAAYDLGEKYRKLEKIKDNNSIIARAKAFKESYDNKLRGLQADREIGIAAEEKLIENERRSLTGQIERLRAEIKAAEDKLLGLGDRLNDKKSVIEAQYQEKLAKLDADTGTANAWADKQPTDITELTDEVATAEAMIKHLNEYKRMQTMQSDMERLRIESEEYTRKINLARELPGEILKTATIPIDGLTVVDGIPLIHGLPISNLSGGELLELCVDIAASKPGQLNILLIDEVGRLDTRSRAALYRKCQEKGIHFVATRATDSADIEVTELNSRAEIDAYEKAELKKSEKEEAVEI